MAAATGIPILESEIEQRVAFAESLTMGQTIFEWAEGSASAREIGSLTKEFKCHVEEDIFSGSKGEATNG